MIKLEEIAKENLPKDFPKLMINATSLSGVCLFEDQFTAVQLSTGKHFVTTKPQEYRDYNGVITLRNI